MRFLKTLFDLFLNLTKWLKTNQLANIAIAKQYLQILLILAILAIVIPAIPALIGLISGWQWLISLAGLLWGLMALFLFLLAAPLGVFIEMLLGVVGLRARNQRAGRRYIIVTGSILLFGMFFALIANFLPWRENPAMIIPLLLAAAILAVAGAVWGTSGILERGMVIFITSLVLVTSTASFFFPKTFAEFNSVRQKIDQGLADKLSGKAVSSADFPICAETEMVRVLNNDVKKIEIPVYPDCRSGWIDIQTRQKTNFRFYKKPEGGFLEIYFMDGSKRIIHENERVWLGDIPRLTFRLRGTKGIVVVEIE